MIRILNKGFQLLTMLVIYQQSAYVFAQKADYISTDTSTSFGIKLISSSPRFNSQYIILKDKNKEIRYTPDQIKEYGLKGGSVYESHKIPVEGILKSVFLERLAYGDITLYRYIDSNHKAYFIVKDTSELKELNRDLEEFKRITTDCEFISDAIPLATYSKLSLRKLIIYYNTCTQKPFPFKKIGVMTGLRLSRLSKSSGFNNSTLESLTDLKSISPMLGVFLDLPIEMSEFSLHPEIFYTFNNFSSGNSSTRTDIDLLVELATIQMPLNVRYTVPTNFWRAFFSAGPYFAYNVRNSSDVYIARIEENVISIEKPIQEDLLDDFMFGYSIGLGIQRNLDIRKYISAEIRYLHASGQNNNTLIYKGIDFVIGFTF